MTLRRSLTVLVGVAALSLAVVACGSSDAAGSGAPADGTVPVVASTNVYGAVVRAVGGEHVSVTSIIDSPDADPHEYESRPADAAAVTKAKLLVMNGGGYDDFATKLVASAGSSPAIVDAVQVSGLEQAAGSGGFNEHVWYHLPTVRKVADQIAKDLGTVDPANAAAYTANATAFDGQVAGLTSKLEAIKAQHAGKRVAVTEPVPLYEIEAAGLVDATPEEFSTAVEEGNDPPAAVLDETMKLVTGGDVKALVSNSQTESPTTTRVEDAAKAAGVPIVSVTETLPAGVDDYVAWQSSQIHALTAALNGTA
ncbi:MAG TPA: zinc ABC transporter substrate-binding protein [Pseudonocardia sp.]|jgi:zinc/manganese transport system substrate-binding protein|nr:zinc ABC transporter substrate-binding protein [Pseudonocardia sp.]